MQLLFAKFLILTRIQRDIVINVKTCSCKIPVILGGFQWDVNLHIKKSSIIKFHQNLSSGAGLFHAKRWTDMTKLMVFFAILWMRLKVYILPTENKQRLFCCTALTCWFFKGDGECLLRGMNCAFKRSIFLFVFKGFISSYLFFMLIVLNWKEMLGCAMKASWCCICGELSASCLSCCTPRKAMTLSFGQESRLNCSSLHFTTRH